MNTLELASAQKILEHVAANDGKLTWYNLVRYVDLQGVEKIPPVFAVAEQLIAEGMLRLDPPDGGNAARYCITEAGRLRLAMSSRRAPSTAA